MEIVIPNTENITVLAKVKKRKLDSMGLLVREANLNPILDTRVCQLESPDGTKANYPVNVINENLFNQTN